MANHFSHLARKSRNNVSTTKVIKEAIDNPPLEIYKLGSKTLRTTAKRISKVDIDTRKLAKEMLQSMYSAKGIGLAAPQVGISKELLVIDINFEDSAAEPLILINPEITAYGSTLNSYEEGCLSIPGVYLNVIRPSTIKLKFRDEMGRPRKMNADGLLARCIQHEVDHLKGVLFVDRVTSKEDLKKELIKEGYKMKDVLPIN
ncbi:putative formylmethionine deformylase [Prochlorococcus marinus str. MIT 9215]|uniref:Peptide deformylase n=1 Tax=Prochlorococcus marinus (strain MIT 9215) TaxID=93060 RepID=A8G268_PROM2|nr:peptide deformylase [Prochlorococcus marinus]ABV49699.1 putative formylmethionine deformylase [Prochlorococcus marinus str. MIT 9215]